MRLISFLLTIIFMLILVGCADKNIDIDAINSQPTKTNQSNKDSSTVQSSGGTAESYNNSDTISKNEKNDNDEINNSSFDDNKTENNSDAVNTESDINTNDKNNNLIPVIPESNDGWSVDIR